MKGAGQVLEIALSVVEADLPEAIDGQILHVSACTYHVTLSGLCKSSYARVAADWPS
jgi:hypothetical protein